jgi:hypothetical protein
MVKINPDLITDDMMYEGNVSAYDNVKELGNSQVSAVDLQRLREDKLWGEIRWAAKTNSTLQYALEECIIIYKLSKEYNNGI